MLSNYVPNHVLVGVAPGYSSPDAALSSLTAMVPGTESRPLGDYGVFLMKLPEGRSVPSAISLLQGQPGIRYAEPDWISELAAVPNDPNYGRMWGMENTGQAVNGTTGTADADIDAEAAWDLTTGSRSVLIAVIDTGVDVQHPDLINNIWVNPGEIAGNGIDDDGNGYVDDVRGYDFVDNDNNVADGYGHGTHVAGTIGAVGDNRTGTVGVNWNVSILPLKASTDSGAFFTSSTVEALNYAVRMGATVSNHSYGGFFRAQAMEDAIIAARTAGHIVVCAAGNNAGNNDFRPAFPASYPQDNVISVAATDQNDGLAGFSNFGATSVDIGAPGVNIWSTAPRAGSLVFAPNYDFSDGTSMASPMVAGAVALLRSLAPTSNYRTIIDAIYLGAEAKPSLAGRVATGARLNVANALQQLPLASISVDRTTIAENAGNNAARLTVRKTIAPVNQPLTVNIIVGDATELSVGGLTGTSVTIPAFQRLITLPINAIDDTLLDGTQRVSITLRIGGNDVETVTIDVTDHETLTLTANPSTVFENAGVGAGTLTIARSNTDIFPPNRVVAVGNELIFYDRQGAESGSRVPVPWPAGVRPTADTVRDVTIMEDGRIAVFNGANTVYVSIYNPGTGNWTHQLIAGATASTTDTGTGGIATSGSIIYISDLQTGSGDPYGIVRYDTTRTGPGAINRVVTKAFGNRLFGSSWPQSSIYELDPTTGAVLKTFASPATGSTMAGMAFDGQYIWYIVDNNNTLYKVDADTGVTVDTFFTGTTTNGSYEGLAWLNGLIYLLDPFITNEIVEFNPVLRAVTRRLPVGQLNVSPGQGGNLNLSGGLTANPSRNSLLVSSTFNNEVYEIDPVSGLFLRKPNGDPRFFVAGFQAQGMATVGDRLYMSEPSGNNKRIFIYDFDGNQQGSIPSPFFFSMFGLGSDGVPGLVDSSYRWRDVTVGLDGFLYALDDAAGIVGKFDPATISALAFINVPTATQAIAVDSTGTIYGGQDDGTIVAMNQSGTVLRQLSTGVGLISDIEVNVTGTVLVSGRGGSFGYSTAALTSVDVYSSGTNSTAFVSFGEHFTKNRAELVVQLTNTDTTELAVPLTVVIPEGQPSVTVPFDAVDDFIRDGAQIVTITASAVGYVPDSEDVVVEDYEAIEVDIIQTTVAENAGANASAVRIRRTDVNGPFTFTTQQSFSNPLTYQLRDRSTTFSPIVVPTQISRLTDVNVTVNFRHDWLGDLDVFLISPKGTRVELFTDLNSNERNMTATVLDDEAQLEIVHGKAPFTGSFMPEGSLSAFDGEEAQGTWRLEVTDDNVNEFGSLLGWSLDFSTIGLAPASITLRSVDPTELGFTGSATRQVVIPANQSEITVFVDAVDDNILDGTQVAQVVAQDVNVVGMILGGDQTDVTDVESLQFTVNRPVVSESDGVAAVTGTLRRFNTDLSLFSLEVQTSRSDKLDFTGVVTGTPFLVQFAAGSDTATFTMDAIDNAIIDGDATVIITVVSPQYGGNLTQQVVVEDQEPRIRITTSTTNPREDSGSISITVQRDASANLGVDLNVDLTTINGTTAALVVPPVVTIPAGLSSISIPVTVLDDALLGNRTVRITGSATGLIDGSLDITVLDYETVTLTVNRTSFLENAGPRAAVGTVTRSNTDRSQPLVVNLASSDTSELTVPAFVTIPAGLPSVSFDIAAINDPDLDGSQLVSVSASATAYFGSNVDITVLDHEPPVVTAPAATTANPRETIRWNPLPGAVRYDLQLANLSLKIPNYIFRSGLTTTSFTPPENLGIGLWRVWVRAYDQFEVPGFWSVARDFRVVTAPTITAPVTTGGVAAATFPDISWTAVADAVRYELWVNNVTTNSNRVIYKTDIRSTTYRELASMGSGTYRAFVRAANAVGEFGNWSLAKEFTVIGQPTVTRPEFTSTFDTTPFFQWTAVVGARYYDLYVANRATKAIVLRDQAVIGTSYQATMDLPKGDYTVWVRAVGDKLVSIWSPPKNFTIGGPPTLLNPVANGVVSANHRFSWTAVGDADKYEIWVQRDSDNATFIQNNIAGTSFQFGSPLSAGTYRVWLRVVSIVGERSAWSAPVRFRVAASKSPVSENPIGEVILAALDRPLLTPEVAPPSDKQQKRTAASVNPDVAVVRELPVDAAVVASAVARDVDAVMETWNTADWWLELPSANPASIPAAAADVIPPAPTEV
ncbi:MAG: S8 family serine peptidase [Planctomycetota bacterium]